jgi:hypothetical protein
MAGGRTMKLPGGDKAYVDVRKLRDYCLSESHPRGRHKARVFAAALGLKAEDAGELRRVLLAAARDAEALPLEKEQYGQRYVVECAMDGPGGPGVIRSFWIVRPDEGFPRLLTCYVV